MGKIRDERGDMPVFEALEQRLLLSVVVADAFESDDVPTDASVIAVDGLEQTRSLTAGDVDWVQFDLAADATVAVITEVSDGDTELWLYDASVTTGNRRWLAYDEQEPGDGDSDYASIGMSLAAGTYYARVNAYDLDGEVAEYTLSVITIPLGDSPLIADPQLEIAILQELDFQPSHVLTLADLESLVWLDADNHGIADLSGLELCSSLEGLELRGNYVSDLSALLGLGSLEELALEANPLSAAALTTDIPALEAAGVTVSPPATPDGFEPNDLPATGTPIAVGSSQDHSLPLVDVDWAVFTTTQQEDIVVMGVGGWFDLLVWDAGVLTGAGTLLDRVEAEGGGGMMLPSLAPGDYYIQIEARHPAESGNYNLLVDTFTDSPLVADPGLELAIKYWMGLAPSDDLTVGGMATLELVYAGELRISDLSGLEYCTALTELDLSNNDVSDIAILTTMPSLQFVDLRGNPLSPESWNTHVPALLDRGVHLDLPGYVDEYEPNDSASGASEIVFGETQIYSLPEDDVDWMTFTLAEETSVGMKITCDEGASLVLFDAGAASGSGLELSHAGNIRDQWEHTLSLSAGDYYIRVSAEWDPVYQYELTVGPNVWPVAANDQIDVAEDTPEVIFVDDLLANDTDMDGDPLTFRSFTLPSNGALVDNGDGMLTYTPQTGFVGRDSFTYTIFDDLGGRSTATVWLHVGTVAYVVNSLLDVVVADGRVTLREAIEAANTNAAVHDAPAGTPGHDLILFDYDALVDEAGPGVPLVINLSNGQLDITDDLVIRGPGSGLLTIDAGGQSRLFAIPGWETAVELHGLTLTGGYADGEVYNEGGGAVNSQSDLTLVDCVISGNATATYGGGIQSFGATMLTNCRLEGNTADSGGGGLWISSYAPSKLTNSVIVGNSSVSGWGGGVGAQYSRIVFSSSTITGNRALGGGGAYIGYRTTLAMNNTIIALNEARYDGNLEIGQGSQPDCLTIQSSLVGIDPGFQQNPFDGGDGWGDDPDTPVDEGLNDDFGDLTLRSTSAGVDSGDASLLNGVAWDIRGPGFDRIVNSTLDIGAYEYQGPPVGGRESPSTVVTTVDAGVNMYDGEISLQEAIMYAENAPGDNVVTFAAAVTDGGVIAMDGSQAIICGDVQIVGPGRSLLTLDGMGLSRIFRIYAGNVRIEGLTLSHGFNSGQGGGGVYSNGALTIADCTISNNEAGGGGGGGGVYANWAGRLVLLDSEILANEGGAIRASGVDVTISRCTISNNSGGGLYTFFVTLHITDSIIRGNDASSSFGGGAMHLRYGESVYVNSVIAANTTLGDGGGIFAESVTIDMINCSVWGNVAGIGGGGIYNEGEGVLTLTNTTISGNSAAVGGGIYGLEPGVLTLFNTAVAGNTAPASADVYGTLSGDSSHNFIGTIDGDPMLAAITDWDGLVRYGVPMPGSPLIDTGNKDFALDPQNVPLTVDQRGMARIFNNEVDIGAIEYAPAGMMGRHVFYNNSSFDGNDSGANPDDNNAIDTSKAALLPGETITPANYTSYSRGINGIMIDVAGLGGMPTADDFDVRVSDGVGWVGGPVPEVSVIPGDGVSGYDGVALIWADGAIVDRWVEVTVLSTANGGGLGLAADDVFYFANLVGDCDGDGEVGSSDYGEFVGEFGQHGSDLVADFNVDGRVDLSDFAIVRGAKGKSVLTPTIPPAAPGAVVESGLGAFAVAAAATLVDPETPIVKTVAPRHVKAAPGRRTPNNDAAAGIDLLVESPLALSGSKGSAAGYISGAQAISGGSSATMVYREATGEYDLRPPGDDPAAGEADDLLVDVLEEAALAGQL